MKVLLMFTDGHQEKCSYHQEIMTLEERTIHHLLRVQSGDPLACFIQRFQSHVLTAVNGTESLMSLGNVCEICF